MNTYPRLLFMFASLGLTATIGLLFLPDPARSQSAGSFVALQPSTPGTMQSGNSNISGTSRASQFVGGGASLSALNGSNITSGFVADVRLTSNVALLNAIQSFAATKTFSVPPVFSFAGAPFTVTNSTLVTNLNADLLDGQHGAYYRNASNLNAGTLSSALLPVPLVLSGAHGTLGIIQATNTHANGTYGVVGEIFGGAGLGHGVYGLNNRTSGSGVHGFASATSGTTYGVFGRTDSQSGYGVYGAALNSNGAARGVYGYVASTGGSGVFGEGATSSYGVYGKSTDGTAVYGVATSGIGVSGFGDEYGGAFQTNSNNGIGVFAQAANPSLGYGIWGTTSASAGAGITGRSENINSTAPAVSGISASSLTSATAIYGDISAGYAVYGKANSGIGIRGESASGYGGFFSGVRGLRASGLGGSGHGVESYGAGSGSGVSAIGGSSGRGVYAESSSAAGAYGISNTGNGVEGNSTTGAGVAGFCTSNDAVFGQTYASGKSSVFGYTSTINANGAYFNSANGTPGGTGIGVVGQSNAPNGFGVFANNSNFGSNGLKLFVIDHPEDPANKLLQHYCVEGPEPMNSYSGTITTDRLGYAWVVLPSYFESINRDPRIQLTVVDDSEDFTIAKVSKKVVSGKFEIRTSKPNTEVFWRVEAVRNDRYVQEFGYEAEREKPIQWRGKYLNPKLYSIPEDRGIFFATPPGSPHAQN